MGTMSNKTEMIKDLESHLFSCFYKNIEKGVLIENIRFLEEFEETFLPLAINYTPQSYIYIKD